LVSCRHTDFVTALDFHPADDKFFLSGSIDGKASLHTLLAQHSGKAETSEHGETVHLLNVGTQTYRHCPQLLGVAFQGQWASPFVLDTVAFQDFSSSYMHSARLGLDRHLALHLPFTLLMHSLTVCSQYAWQQVMSFMPCRTQLRAFELTACVCGVLFPTAPQVL